MTRRPISTAFAAALALGSSAWAQDAARFVVKAQLRADEKAIFATVESADVATARARNGGVVASLIVNEGDRVEAGQQIAVIGDDKLGLQLTALTSNVRSFEASRSKARVDLERAQRLFERGIAAKAQLDAAQAAFDAADGAYQAARAERNVVVEREREGAVLAPNAGVVLRVSVIDGAVVLPGEAIADIASEVFVLRLALPERHARFIKVGDPVRVDAAALTGAVDGEGAIVRVYPLVANGRVLADARVDGLGGFFVGERVRVALKTEPRRQIIAPAGFIATRSGVDFATVVGEDGAPRDVAVQLGRPSVMDDGAPGVEVLAGLADGDVLVAP